MKKNPLKPSGKRITDDGDTTPVAEETGTEISHTPTEDRYRTFALEYLSNGFHATNAAIAAGFSEKSASAQASQLLKNPKVLAILQAERDKLFRKKEITAEAVLEEMRRLAFANIKQVMQWTESGATLTASDSLDDEDSAIIESIEITTEYKTGREEDDDDKIVKKTKVKMHDKLGALRDLFKYLKLGGPTELNLNVRPDLSNLTEEELLAFLALSEKVTK